MPVSLFSLEVEDLGKEVPRGLPLIITMLGASDSGGVVAGLDRYIWDNCDPRVVLRFKPDLLLDYRSRRPLMKFEGNRFTAYEPDELVLALATDELGGQFLVLSGFEPDYRWERFTEVVLLLIRELAVSVTSWVQALPMPVPHTRPLVKTISGTKPELIEELSDWNPDTRLSASIVHLLEFQLTNLNKPVVGCTLSLPHYLSSTEYPDGLLAAISVLSSITGLIFATEELLERSQRFNQQVDRQVAENDEHREMVISLEQRFDALQHEKENSGLSPILGDGESIPSADEIADEFEQYLAAAISDEGGADPDTGDDQAF